MVEAKLSLWRSGPFHIKKHVTTAWENATLDACMHANDQSGLWLLMSNPFSK